MSQKLYVGNLPYNMTSEALEDLFLEVGQLASARVIMDKESGRSKGFGFVEMLSPELAHDAITKLNEKNVGGRPLKVSLAREPNRSSSHSPMVEYR